MLLLHFLTGTILGTIFMGITLILLNINFEPLEKRNEEMKEEIKDLKKFYEELHKSER